MTWLLDPRLRHCRRIFLREVVLDANIGIHDSEKAGAQKLVISVDLFVPLEMSSPKHDLISEVVDYDIVRTVVRNRIGRGHIHLQETLIDDVANELLTYPGVFAVRVSSEKPDVYADVEAVGIELFKFKEAST